MSPIRQVCHPALRDRRRPGEGGRSPAPPGARPEGLAGRPLPSSLPPSLPPSLPVPLPPRVPVAPLPREAAALTACPCHCGPAVTEPRAAAEAASGAAPPGEAAIAIAGLRWPCREPGSGWGLGAASGRGPDSGQPLIQFGFFSYFPLLSPALSLLCQLSEMLCLTGSLSQISYHLKPLGRER